MFTQGPRSAPPLHHSYRSAWVDAGTALQPPHSRAKRRSVISFLLRVIHKDTCTKHKNRGRERKERERGQSEESYKNCQVCTPVCDCCVCVCVGLCAVEKEKVSLHQQGPPATRVRALLGWRPGTDLGECLKCRLHILCTKSLQEYLWPLESLSGFFSGPAVAAHPSLKSSGPAEDEDPGRTH